MNANYSPLFALSTDHQFSPSPKILLVEDNRLARNAEQLMLESLGCEVIAAETGEQGLKLFDAQFDAVIVDIDLPGISGLEVAQAIRKNHPILPIIACTSANRFSEEAYKAAGINLVLEKPMRIEQMYHCLASYWHQVVH